MEIINIPCDSCKNYSKCSGKNSLIIKRDDLWENTERVLVHLMPLLDLSYKNCNGNKSR